MKDKPEQVKEGTALYVGKCACCHGVLGVDRGGNIANLGDSRPEVIANLEGCLFKGAAKDRRMPDVTGRLKPEDADKLRAFIHGTADGVRPRAN